MVASHAVHLLSKLHVPLPHLPFKLHVARLLPVLRGIPLSSHAQIFGLDSTWDVSSAEERCCARR